MPFSMTARSSLSGGAVACPPDCTGPMHHDAATTTVSNRAIRLRLIAMTPEGKWFAPSGRATLMPVYAFEENTGETNKQSPVSRHALSSADDSLTKLCASAPLREIGEEN